MTYTFHAETQNVAPFSRLLWLLGSSAQKRQDLKRLNSSNLASVLLSLVLFTHLRSCKFPYTMEPMAMIMCSQHAILHEFVIADCDLRLSQQLQFRGRVVWCTPHRTARMRTPLRTAIISGELLRQPVTDLTHRPIPALPSPCNTEDLY